MTFEVLENGPDRKRCLEVSMRSTEELSITLPSDLAELVQGKIASGEYSSESEVFWDGLRALQFRDQLIGDWLYEQVGRTH
jgi:antitoxin ParD1/3/4